jgi:hypothetical protein
MAGEFVTFGYRRLAAIVSRSLERRKSFNYLANEPLDISNCGEDFKKGDRLLPDYNITMSSQVTVAAVACGFFLPSATSSAVNSKPKGKNSRRNLHFGTSKNWSAFETNSQSFLQNKSTNFVARWTSDGCRKQLPLDVSYFQVNDTHVFRHLVLRKW